MDRPGSMGTIWEAAPFRCPCCGLFTLEEEPPGTCLICPLCLWQDDEAQFKQPNMEATVNGVSLEQARLNYREIAISDPQLRRYQRGRAVRFSFHSHGTWAVANIADGRRGYIMVPCFLSDGLADLVDAVNQVFECGSGRCAWVDEPGQWLWELIRKGDDIQIQILRFRNWHLGARLDPHCQTWMRDFQGVEFEMTCSLASFGSEVRIAAESVLLNQTEDEYAVASRHSYPRAAVDRLRDHLAGLR